MVDRIIRSRAIYLYYIQTLVHKINLINLTNVHSMIYLASMVRTPGNLPGYDMATYSILALSYL